MLTDQTKLIEALREALQTAAFNMKTMAGDIKNPGQRALVDRWIKQAHGAAALQSPVAAVSDGVREEDASAEARDYGLGWLGETVDNLATPAPDQGEVERLHAALDLAHSRLRSHTVDAIARGDKRAGEFSQWADEARAVVIALHPDTDRGDG